MRGRAAASAPIFALQSSGLGNFLYAPIGEEENGMVVTALSALARIGVDPWQEAACLTRLPADEATDRMTTVIAGLSNGRWAKSDAGAIAARLIALLPAPAVSRTPSAAPRHGNRSLSYRIAIVAFFVMLNIAVFVVFRGHETSPFNGFGNGATSAATTLPDVAPVGSK
jgi:hypothetical protein